LKGKNLLLSLRFYVEENEFDMLVMLSHKRDWLQEFWKKPNAKIMSYQSKIPVMAYHA
jgi:Universal stress protein UspA and related nucleotide-binding proteins